MYVVERARVTGSLCARPCLPSGALFAVLVACSSAPSSDAPTAPQAVPPPSGDASAPPGPDAPQLPPAVVFAKS